MTTATETISAPASTNEQRTKRTKRTKVEHYFWTADMNFAAEVQVDMRSLCGVWDEPQESPASNFIPVVGGLVPLPDPEDCKRCLRVLAAELRRRNLGRYGR